MTYTGNALINYLQQLYVNKVPICIEVSCSPCIICNLY